MERHFDEELAGLKHTLVRMAGLAEDMIGDAMRMLVERDASVRDELNRHEVEVNQMQRDVDEICLKLLALHQPTASDLRFILGAIKTNSELERLADLAINILHKAQRLAEQPPLITFTVLPEMAALAAGMVKDSIHAYVNRSVDEARAVILRDARLNEMKAQATDKLLAMMRADAATLERAVNVLLVTRNIERIGDHAKNIAENAIFVAEGRDVRHRRECG